MFVSIRQSGGCSSEVVEEAGPVENVETDERKWKHHSGHCVNLTDAVHVAVARCRYRLHAVVLAAHCRPAPTLAHCRPHAAAALATLTPSWLQTGSARYVEFLTSAGSRITTVRVT